MTAEAAAPGRTRRPEGARTDLAPDLRPDLCVVGAGAAGLSVAAIAASFGVPTVLVERGRMGGDCLNVGCVPSKALLAAADRAQAMRTAPELGIAPGPEGPVVDAPAVRAHLRRVIAAIAPNDSVARYEAMGVTVLRAEAEFRDGASLVARAPSGETRVRARRFVLATGSRPRLPPIPGLEEVGALTNETVFDLAETPDHLLVLGGGPVGVELAQAHRRLGARVTLVARAPRLLPREDAELAAIVERALRREGVALHLGAEVLGAARDAGGRVVLTLADGVRASGSHLLVAVGREVVTAGLGLGAAGIAVDPDGIRVDRSLRTTNPRVYAIGDAAGAGGGGQRLTHVGNYHAGLVIRGALFRIPARVDLRAIPRVTYTDPELAAVGLSEAQARAAGRRFQVLRWPFHENDRAQAEGATEGHVKAIVAPNGRVLGCAIAGRHAGELITPWTLAIAKGLKARDLAGIVIPYPTLSEVTKRAAVEHVRPAAARPLVRRLLRVLRDFG